MNEQIMNKLLKYIVFVTLVSIITLLACSPEPKTPGKVMATPQNIRFVGLNRAGAEYGDDWDGWTGQMYYTWPTTAVRRAEFAYYKSKGVNTIRLPISWERLQHTLNGPLDATYQSKMIEYVNDATNAYNLNVVLDLHNYGRYAVGAFDTTGRQVNTYTKRTLGDGTLTFAHVVDVWTKLSTIFKDNAKVIFNLMNEQHDAAGTLDSTAVFAGYQKVLEAVRAAGATQLVLFPNTRSSDTHHWSTWSPEGGPLDSSAALSVKDPGNNLAFDMHSYQGIDAWNADIQVVTTWARTNGKRLFLSEVGTTNGSAAVSAILTHLNSNADVWLGWTTWNLDPYTIMVTNLSTGEVTDTDKMAWYAPFMPLPPPSCTYAYSAWKACDPNGTQTRTATASPDGCVGTPVLNQSCVYTPPSCVYSYSAWSPCLSTNVQTRTLVSTSPSGCTGTPTLSQACSPPADADLDGVADDLDKCPTVKGIKTTDGTSNGCLPLVVTSVKTHDWNSGFCRQYTFKNPNPVPMSWKTMTIYLKDSRLRGSSAVWGANFPNASATGTIVVTPTNNAEIPANSSVKTVGFCADYGPSKYAGTSKGLTY